MHTIKDYFNPFIGDKMKQGLQGMIIKHKVIDVNPLMQRRGMRGFCTKQLPEKTLGLMLKEIVISTPIPIWKNLGVNFIKIPSNQGLSMEIVNEFHMF